MYIGPYVIELDPSDYYGSTIGLTPELAKALGEELLAFGRKTETA